MANRDKIIIMAKMASYDKNHGEADRKVFSFFRRDYIYRKNMWTRLCVTLGAGFLAALYWLYQLFVYGINIRDLDIQQSITDTVLFLLAVMAFYTLIGTIQGTHQYHLVQKRMEKYLSMIQELEHMPDNPAPPVDDGDDILIYDMQRRRRGR